jgi:hypothetical protein
MNFNKFSKLITVLIITAMVGLFVFGDAVVYTLTYIIVYMVLLFRTFQTHGRVRLKLALFTSYSLVLAVQIVMYQTLLARPEQAALTWQDISFWSRKLICTVILLLPAAASRYVTVDKYARFYLPSIEEVGSIAFANLVGGAAKISFVIDKAAQAKRGFSRKNISAIFGELPRHSSFEYINNGTLTDAYFAKAQETYSDPHIYIVISNTGSPASEMISVFTSTYYNHASLSFDRDLATIVSYNGGDRVYPPGLNPEMLTYFKQKSDSGILVYSIPCTYEQKSEIISKIREINENGSAYNMLGLIMKKSYKPNIMFCSQFVYRMLELSSLAYFNKPNGKVKPSDLIELDYYRKLSFEYEVKL